MKKLFNYASMLLLACAMIFTMTACGGDDDDSVDNGNGNSTFASKIVGSTWYSYEEDSREINVWGFSFRSNGNGTVYTLYRGPSDNFSKTKEEIEDIKYSITGNKLTVVFDDGGKDYTETYVVTENADGIVTWNRNGDIITVYRLNSGTLYDIIAELSKKHQK